MLDQMVEKYSLRDFAICFELVILTLSISKVIGMVMDDCLKVTNSFIPFLHIPTISMNIIVII